jgi:hypothetical protein
MRSKKWLDVLDLNQTLYDRGSTIRMETVYGSDQIQPQRLDLTRHSNSRSRRLRRR